MSNRMSNAKLRSLKRLFKSEVLGDADHTHVADGVHVYSSKLSRRFSGENTEICVRTLTRLNKQKPNWSIKKILDTYRVCSEYLMDLYAVRNSLCIDMIEENNSLLTGSARRNGKRWTDEEDEALIEAAAQPDSTMMTLALNFGRTPGAIQSRITYLVGIERLSQQVCGRLTGFVNGEPFEGDVKGVVIKKKAAA